MGGQLTKEFVDGASGPPAPGSSNKSVGSNSDAMSYTKRHTSKSKYPLDKRRHSDIVKGRSREEGDSKPARATVTPRAGSSRGKDTDLLTSASTSRESTASTRSTMPMGDAFPGRQERRLAEQVESEDDDDAGEDVYDDDEYDEDDGDLGDDFDADDDDGDESGDDGEDAVDVKNDPAFFDGLLPPLPTTTSSGVGDGGISPAMRPSEQQATPKSAAPATELTRMAVVGKKWRKGELIGRGSFGSVYLGMNVETGGLFVIKSVPFTPVKGDDKVNEEVKQLEQEIAILEKLRHPNIVTYLGSERDEVNHELMIFLEYMSGGSISEQLSKFGAFDDQIIRKYSAETLRGLEFLHGNGILHRDIKGQNLLVNRLGVCKIADFGAGKALVMDTQACSLKGTPVFMAPEVITQMLYSRASDVWSIGCTLIEMATAARPFNQLSNPIAVIMHISQSQDPISIPPNLSPDLTAFIQRCLQRDPHARPTCTDLLKDPFLAELETPSAAASRGAPTAGAGADGADVFAIGEDSLFAELKAGDKNNYLQEVARQCEALAALGLSRQVSPEVAEILRCFTGSVAVIETSAPGYNVFFASPEFGRLVGAPLSSVVGKPYDGLQGPKTEPDRVALLYEMLDSNQPGRVVLTSHRQSGAAFQHDIVLMPVQAQTGKMAFTLGLSADLTPFARTVVPEKEEVLASSGRRLMLLTSDALANACDEVPFASDFVTGHVMFAAASRTTMSRKVADAAPVLRTSGELGFLAVQLKVVHHIQGDVFIGLEVENKVPSGPITELITRLVHVLGANVHVSRGRTSRGECAHLASPLFQCPITIIETLPGDEPPQLSLQALPKPSPDRPPVRRFRKGYTYTFQLSTSRIDACNWSLIRIPGIAPISLKDLLRSQSVHVVAYTIPAGARHHSFQHQQRIFDFELLHESLPMFHKFVS